jgi:chromate reductase
MFKVAVLVGSIRPNSTNLQFARAIEKLALGRLQFEFIDIGSLPFYDETLWENPPSSVVDLKQRIHAADAVLFVTPEYNRSIPGVLKNAIDWLSRLTPQPFAAKPIAMFGAAGGPLGTARAQYHLRQMMVFLDGRPVNKPEVMIGAAQTKFVDGKFTDEAGAKLLADLGVALALAVRQAKAAATVK